MVGKSPAARRLDDAHHYDQAVRAENLREILAVPVRSVGGIHGVVYAGMRRPTCTGDRAMDQAASVARRIQREIALEVELHRRMSRSGETASHPPVVDQRLRDVHAELALIRNGASGRTRALIEDLMHRLSRGGDVMPLRGVPWNGQPAGQPTRELDVITQAPRA